MAGQSALAMAERTDDKPEGDSPSMELVFEAMRHAELMHRQFLEVMRMILQDILRAEDVDAAAAFMMLMMGAEEETNLSAVRAQGWYNKTNLTQVVQKLDELGYIRRSNGAGSDGRKVLIRLQPKGRQLTENIRQCFAGHAAQLRGLDLGTDQVKQHIALSARLRTFSQSLFHTPRQAVPS